jgi:hypothetical protein
LLKAMASFTWLACLTTLVPQAQDKSPDRTDSTVIAGLQYQPAIELPANRPLLWRFDGNRGVNVGDIRLRLGGHLARLHTE